MTVSPTTLASALRRLGHKVEIVNQGTGIMGKSKNGQSYFWNPYVESENMERVLRSEVRKVDPYVVFWMDYQGRRWLKTGWDGTEKGLDWPHYPPSETDCGVWAEALIALDAAAALQSTGGKG